MNNPSPQRLLLSLFHKAVETADARHLLNSDYLSPLWPVSHKGRTIVIGAGKAASAMAVAVENIWTEMSGASKQMISQANTPLSGLVITPYGYGLKTNHIQSIEAAHPVPDQQGVKAASDILRMIDNLTAEDLVICLISGGGSALMVQPPPNVALHDKQNLTKALLQSGATIKEINSVRKHLSLIKGGRLAAKALPAQLITFAISDVVGDDPSLIASGPTVGDPSCREDALAILETYNIQLPPTIESWLLSPLAETPKPGDAAFTAGSYHLITTPGKVLSEVMRFAASQGLTCHNLGASIEGEARDVGYDHSRVVKANGDRGGHIFLSGGELTVTMRGTGKGGPNTEYLLSLAIALDGAPDVYALACDTDGKDGSENNAGAYITLIALPGPKRLVSIHNIISITMMLIVSLPAWGISL